jgi:hypothetical protein
VNGDLSHYIYRGITKGAGLDAVLSRVGHMHQRMARAHGDLSADVVDPAAEWADLEGPLRLAWDMARRALKGGLSSRAVMGETGPMNLVGGDRTLDLDASLLPLYRLMADYADQQVGQAPLRSNWMSTCASPRPACPPAGLARLTPCAAQAGVAVRRGAR